MIKIKRMVLVILLFSLTSGLGCTGQPKTSSLNVDSLSPEQLVETYYRSLSSNDIITARNCLSDEMKEMMDTVPDSDFKNLKSLTSLKVSTAYPIKLYGNNYEEVQVVAEYHAVYKEVTCLPNGKQHRFIYVAKATPDSPWRIISIGTGP